MRDASFTLWALHALGLDWEADDFIEYVAEVPRNEDGSLQIMYGVRGEKDLEESTLDHLKGYEGSRPVRIGNGAYNQRQNDVYGAVLDSVYLHSKKRDHIPERLWPVLIDQVKCAADGVAGARPGHLGGAREAPALRLLEADVLGRARSRRAAGRTARPRGVTPRNSRRIADEVREDILEHGVDERGVFRQHYDTDALDASTLLVPLLRFLPPDDERVRATVARSATS